MSKIIGIDLGTTNSCVAVIEGGVPCIIENSEGERTTPSVVAFGPNDDVSVGQAAQRQAVTNPSNTLYGVKRLIGRKSADADVQAQLATSPFAMSATSNGDTRVDIEGKSMSPPEISARVLMKMKQASEAYLGEPVTEAVVTVPAHFDNTQR